MKKNRKTSIVSQGILMLFILALTYGCKKNDIKNYRTFYYAVHESDTAILSIGTHKDRFFGQYEIYYGNRSVKDSGNVEGTISGDTLRGKFRYRAFGGTINVKPIIFLKQQEKLILGSGVTAIFMNIPYYMPGTIEFENSKFTFLKTSGDKNSQTLN